MVNNGGWSEANYVHMSPVIWLGSGLLDLVPYKSDMCHGALQDFLQVLGAHFSEVQATMRNFFTSTVSTFRSVDAVQLGKLCSHMLTSSFKAGKHWSLGSEQQVFFVKVLGLQEGRAVIGLVYVPVTLHGCAWSTARNLHTCFYAVAFNAKSGP